MSRCCCGANRDGTTTLAPFNLISSWYWVYGEAERPALLRALQAAISTATPARKPGRLDADGDGALSLAN